MFKKNDPAPVRQPTEGSLIVREDATFPAQTEPYRSTGSGFASTATTATIGETMRLKGDLYGEEDVLIQGSVEGTINLPDNMLTIGEHGKINATVNARSVAIYGSVSGELNCDEQLVLHRSGRVTGNIVTPRVTLEDGCYFKGAIDMESKEENQQPMGNVSDLSLHTETRKTESRKSATGTK